MQRAFEDIYERFERLHAFVEESIEGLPPAALDFVPGPDMNSLSVLVVHLAGSERYWIGDVAGQDPSDRVRESEFHVRGLDEAFLRRRLTEVLGHTRGVLERLSLSDLEAERVLPAEGRTLTVASALAHALEHTGIHVGQVQIGRQLVEQHREMWK